MGTPPVSLAISPSGQAIAPDEVSFPGLEAVTASAQPDSKRLREIESEAQNALPSRGERNRPQPPPLLEASQAACAHSCRWCRPPTPGKAITLPSPREPLARDSGESLPSVRCGRSPL